MAKWYMGPCPAVTRKGHPCPNNGNKQDGYLCHVHREIPEHRIAAFVAAQSVSDHPADMAQRDQDMLDLAQEIEEQFFDYWKEMVQCEATTRTGARCAREMRRIWATTDSGVFCKSHGGGRGGMTLEQAISAIR